jgi:hypothetical protein
MTVHIERKAPICKPYSPEELRRLFASRPLNILVWLTTHSVDRYRERFRPHLEGGKAKGELYARMRKEGSFDTTAPRWLAPTNSKTAQGYVTIADEIVLPIIDKRTQAQRFIAVTCLYRHEL